MQRDRDLQEMKTFCPHQKAAHNETGKHSPRHAEHLHSGFNFSIPLESLVNGPKADKILCLLLLCLRAVGSKEHLNLANSGVLSGLRSLAAEVSCNCL